MLRYVHTLAQTPDIECSPTVFMDIEACKSHKLTHMRIAPR